MLLRITFVEFNFTIPWTLYAYAQHVKGISIIDKVHNESTTAKAHFFP